jgi:hypothetical protein
MAMKPFSTALADKQGIKFARDTTTCNRQSWQRTHSTTRCAISNKDLTAARTPAAVGAQGVDMSWVLLKETTADVAVLGRMEPCT